MEQILVALTSAKLSPDQIFLIIILFFLFLYIDPVVDGAT